MVIEEFDYREPIDELFHLIDGNSGLTEEFVYYNSPSLGEKGIPILSGATVKDNLLGYVSRNAKPSGKKLKIFFGPAILIVRKGKAGHMIFVGDPEFTTNDDAYVLTVKEKWKNRVSLRWFAYQYQELFYNLATTKSANATFNKEYAKLQKIKIPKIASQDAIGEKLQNVDKMITCLQELKKQLEEPVEYQIEWSLITS